MFPTRSECFKVKIPVDGIEDFQPFFGIIVTQLPSHWNIKSFAVTGFQPVGKLTIAEELDLM